MTLAIISLAVCIIATAIFICVSLLKGGKWGLITKIIASLCFVVAGLLAILHLPKSITDSTWAWFLFTGLALGMAGDVFMDIKEKDITDTNIYLNSGMLCFGIGHFMYFAGLTLVADLRCNVLIPTGIAIVLGLIITLLIFLNSSSFGIKWGKAKWQSFAYSVALASMFVYSVAMAVLDKHLWMFAVAMALFFISDIILSLIYFADKKTHLMRTLNWSTYYLAQQAIVLFIFLI